MMDVIPQDVLDAEFERIRRLEGKTKYLTRPSRGDDLTMEYSRRATYLQRWWDKHPEDLIVLKTRVRLGIIK